MTTVTSFFFKFYYLARRTVITVKFRHHCKRINDCLLSLIAVISTLCFHREKKRETKGHFHDGGTKQCAECKKVEAKQKVVTYLTSSFLSESFESARLKVGIHLLQLVVTPKKQQPRTVSSSRTYYTHKFKKGYAIIILLWIAAIVFPT